MFTDPVKNLKAFGLKENDIVADLGAGTGFYSIEAAKMVPKGKVYAVEVIKDFLLGIKTKAKDAKLHNVECLWGDIEKPGGTKIGANVITAAIASNILFQVENKIKFIEEVHRILKPGGRVLLIDWFPGSFAAGANGDKTISKAKAREMFETRMFTFERDIEAGAHHYGMIFTKS